MTDLLTVLRVLNILIWGALFAFVVGGAWTAIRGKDVRRSDPWRLGVAAVSAFIILGNLRWILAPDSDALFRAIYMMGAIVGLYKIYLVCTYGRGPKL